MVDLNTLSLPQLFETLTADGSLQRLLEAARAEDLAEIGDVTTASLVAGGVTARARGVARAGGVVAGTAAIGVILEAFGCTTRSTIMTSDGTQCTGGQGLWQLEGPRAEILTVERTLLNIISRLSGIATETSRYVQRIAGSGAVVCDTRKTTPGLRSIEKYAVRCGGGTLHRLGLYDALLIKDNHRAHLRPDELAAAISEACRRGRERYDLRFVEVEVDTLSELEQVLRCPPGLIDIVLLDNMTVGELSEAVRVRDGCDGRVQLEASGGITLDNVRAVAETGVERISVGAITQSAPAMDIALEMEQLMRDR